MHNSKSILVTGGAGYIGSHVCKEISRQGWTPVVYDNLSTGHDWAVQWGPLEKGDIRDSGRLRSVFMKYTPESVIHLAAHAYVGESVRDPEKYYLNNVAGTLSLLAVMKELKIQKIVFSSSCATYGLPDKIPITEHQEQRPINPYGTSKLYVERILADYVSAYSFKAFCLRYFNAAGADPDGDTGEVHDPEPHIIPIAINVARGKLDHVSIFGNDYDTPDGTCIRDYTHVSDLARAHVAAIAYINDPCFTFDGLNLGIGKGYSVLEIIQAVENVSMKRVPFVFSDRRRGDPPILISDPEKARKILGWHPRFISIEDMVRHAWNYNS